MQNIKKLCQLSFTVVGFSPMLWRVLKSFWLYNWFSMWCSCLWPYHSKVMNGTIQFVQLNVWMSLKVACYPHPGYSCVLNWHSPLVLSDMYRVDWSLNRINRFSRSFLINLTTIDIWRIYGYVQHRHRYSKPLNQPIRNKCRNYPWCKYNSLLGAARWLSAIKMPLHQYFRLFDYRDICISYIPTNEPCRAFGCDLISLSWLYYLVDKSSELPGRQLLAMNDVYLWR